MKNRKHSNLGATSAVANSLNPVVNLRKVTDPKILDQQELFNEAKRQCEPLLKAGKKLVNAKRFIGKYTARPNGLNDDTIRKILSKGSDLKSLCRGANPEGKVKEVVAAYEYKKMQSGDATRIVNPPKHNSPNVRNTRLSPDMCSKRDLLFEIDLGDDRLILTGGGQVKTGTAKYIADSLADMAQKEGYGKTAILDAKYVNPNGTPRIASDAFTSGQARKIQESGVRLRGVKDLDIRGKELLKNINQTEKDGLDPVARKQVKQLQADIAKAYKGKAIAGRVAGNAALAFAAAAVLSLVVQYATNKRVDIKPVLMSGGQAAVYGGAGVLADAGLYQIAVKMGRTAQEAKAFAQQGVTIGFCVLAAASDAISEFKSYKTGEITALDAVAGGSFKAALDLLPIITAPLGLLGIPICVGAQIGGRLLISKIRAADEVIFEKIQAMNRRIDHLEDLSDENDRLFKSLGLTVEPTLRIIK